MPNAQWYYTDARRERQGPLAAAQLKQLFAQGELDGSSLVWRAGMEQWQPLQALTQELTLPGSSEGGQDAANPYAASAAATMEPMAELDGRLQAYADFVGHNFDKYRQKWRLDGSEPNASGTWHWPAFFFGVMWMLYRRMYALAAVWAVGSVVLATGLVLLGIPEVAGLGVNIGIAIAAGSLGNAFYLRHAQKVIQQVASAHDSGIHGLRAALRLRGGTSGMAVVVGIVVLLALNLSVAAMLG